MNSTANFERIFGYIALFLLNNGFDYILYPTIMAEYGVVVGHFIMFGIVLVLNGALLHLHNVTKKDWASILLIREVIADCASARQYFQVDDSWSRVEFAFRLACWAITWLLAWPFRALARAALRQRWALFFWMCMKEDGLYATLIIKEDFFGELTARDWCRFFWANFFATLYWSVIVGAVVVFWESQINPFLCQWSEVCALIGWVTEVSEVLFNSIEGFVSNPANVAAIVGPLLLADYWRLRNTR